MRSRSRPPPTSSTRRPISRRTNVYTVRAVRAGRELPASTPATLRAQAPVQQFLTVPLQRPAGGPVDVPGRRADGELHLRPERRERRRPRRRRRVRNRRQMGSLEREGHCIARTVRPADSRCLPPRRDAALAYRSRQEHSCRRSLHPVHRLRPRRRWPRRNRVQDRRRHGRRPGPGHRRCRRRTTVRSRCRPTARR